MKNLSVFLSLIFYTTAVFALPPDGMVYELKASIVKIRVTLGNSHTSIGSGVVVAKGQVVTSCHVVANALAINVIKFGTSHRANSIKADWKHDICIIGFDGLDTESATLGSSKNLQYEQPVFTISFPNNAPKPLATYGFVKALYPMDDSVIIRSTSDFRMGASGGGMFSEDGKLVGIITLKSPGRNAYFYNMPVEWVQALLDKSAQDLPAKSELPFWDAPEENRPYFMRVIQPYQTQDWPALKKVASEWLQLEPNTEEAINYLAIAEYHLNERNQALAHFTQLYANNKRHVNALLYIGLNEAELGNKEGVLKTVALLNDLDAEAATQINAKLNEQLGLAQKADCQVANC